MAKLTKGRVVVSSNFKETMDLAKKVYDKHLADGAGSLLKDLEDADWAVSGPMIAPALALHVEAERLAGEAEKLYRQRDASGDIVKQALMSSKSLLKGRYASKPKTMADWGFEIDDTPPAKKPKPKS